MNTTAQWKLLCKNTALMFRRPNIWFAILFFPLTIIALINFMFQAFGILVIRTFQIPTQLLDVILNLEQHFIYKVIFLLFASPLIVLKFCFHPVLFFSHEILNLTFNICVHAITRGKAQWMNIIFLDTLGEYTKPTE
ncbi:MAG: hypothetical protein FWD89_00810 [Firmicutes bacterium]|nr:hypothetical protein [Bacillota bacterium]MCL2770836.1 hypothetical protein [Bacillota bacterium]